MKKLMSVLMIMAMIVMLTACGSKKVEEPETEESTEIVENISGGWMVQTTEASYLKEGQADVMNMALEDYTGLSIHPIAVIGTQVVAGTNYAYLCLTSPVVPNAVSSYAIVTVYQDLDGNCEITDVQPLDYAKLTNADVITGEPLLGGWMVPEADFTPELEVGAEAFEKAAGGIDGAGFTPYACIGTQVVAGTNYLYICNTTMVLQNPVNYLSVVVVYEDLEGNCEMTDILAITPIMIAE